MTSVFIKVPVSENHIGKWCFYLTPTGFKGFGLIEKPSVCQGLYRCNDTYACFVLEEIELPTESDVEIQFINKDWISIQDAKDGANFILDKLKGECNE